MALLFLSFLAPFLVPFLTPFLAPFDCPFSPFNSYFFSAIERILAFSRSGRYVAYDKLSSLHKSRYDTLSLQHNMVSACSLAIRNVSVLVPRLLNTCKNEDIELTTHETSFFDTLNRCKRSIATDFPSRLLLLITF